MSQDALLPCRRFSVEVTLGAHDGLTLVEQFALRSIMLGAQRVESLVEVLGLPPRMLLDISIDLLSRGLIDVAPDGALEVHASVQEAIGDPTLPKKEWYLAFQSADLPEPRSIALFQDLVAGQVFLARRFPIPERQRLPSMPENADVPDLDEIPQGLLLSAVTQALRAGAPVDTQGDLQGEVPVLPRDARVLQVRLRRSGPSGGPVSHVDATRVRVPVQLHVRDRGDLEPPEVRILGPSLVPSGARRRIESTLSDLWSRDFGRGPGQFFDRIHRSSVAVAEDPEPLHVAPDRAVQRFDVVLASSATPPEQQHRELVALDGTLGSILEFLASHAATSEVIAGTARRFRDEAVEALRTARQQVVLACPWIRQIGRNAELQDALRSAVHRGLTVVVIWGIDRESLSDVDPAWTFLTELERQARETAGALLLAQRGALSHAKVIVSDMDWALVSSCNFLNADVDRGTREVGIRIRSSDEGVPLPLQMVLTWTRRLLPDYRLRERCMDAPVLFNRSEARRTDTLGEVILPPQLELGEIGVQAWAAAWQRRRSEVGRLQLPARSAVVPIIDARHRELMVHAIARAQSRIGIVSHQVRIHGLSESIVEALLGAMSRGVAVRISHDASAYADVDPAACDRLERLAHAGAMVTALDNHAKFFVCDDWALVSSHNFLSLDPGLRSAHELGLQVFHPDAVETLWSLCSAAAA